MIRRLDAAAADFSESLASLRNLPSTAVQEVVADVIRRVREEGDAALLAFSEKFDGFRPDTAAGFYAPVSAAAKTQISPPLLEALEKAAARVSDYHQRQMPQAWEHTDSLGNMYGETITPVAHAAVYAPGGQAAYPSSVLMGVIPAKIAGVPKITLITPATDGVLPPITLAAAAVAGADHVVMLGGAQAVAAAALGTETISRADVIAGPGNVFVAEAKRQLYGEIGIDSLAGPSEVLIISDESADPKWVAADMMAQAEHDAIAQSIAISPNKEHLEQVAAELAAETPRQPRAALIAESLSARGALISAPDMEACCRIADEIAAEHVQIMCADADSVAARIHNAGGVFIGAHSCVALGDYGAGPNHVLPTAQTARFASPLGVGNFLRRAGVLRASAEGAAVWAETAAVLAEAEGLFAHAASAKLRMTPKT